MLNAKDIPWYIVCLGILVGIIAVWWQFLAHVEPTASLPTSASDAHTISVNTVGSLTNKGKTLVQELVKGGGAVVRVSNALQPVRTIIGKSVLSLNVQSPSGTVRHVITTVTAPEANGSDLVVSVQPNPIEITIKEPEHSRIGIIGGTFPGFVALDVQTLRGYPAKSLGLDLEASIDVQAGLQQAGVGLSLGGKTFATGGGYLTYAGQTGWYIGGGLRF